jgi:hypothetical protein
MSSQSKGKQPLSAGYSADDRWQRGKNLLAPESAVIVPRD